MTRRPAVQIRPFRIFVIAELVDGEKYAAVSDSEVDCYLGNGVKSRELTSGDPCCRDSPKYTYLVTSRDFVGEEIRFGEVCAALFVGVHASSLERFLCQFECARPERSVVFAWLDLLRMESTSRSKARRGAAWMWPKEGWPAQHGARERREVSLVEITTGVHRGAGGTWGTKKIPKYWPWM